MKVIMLIFWFDSNFEMKSKITVVIFILCVTQILSFYKMLFIRVNFLLYFLMLSAGKVNSKFPPEFLD